MKLQEQGHQITKDIRIKSVKELKHDLEFSPKNYY